MTDKLIKDEEPIGLEVYAKYVFKKALNIYSSGAIAFILVIWGFISGGFTSLLIIIAIYLLFTVVLMFVATYQLWEEERKDRFNIIEADQTKKSELENLLNDKSLSDKEVRELQRLLLQRESDRKPHLSGSVSDINLSQIPDSSGQVILGTRVLIRLGFSNSSQVPTTISEFILNISAANGGHFLGHAGKDPSKFGFGQRDCIDIYDLGSDEKKLLTRRFADGQKAELGEKHEGLLFFDFDLIKNPKEGFDWFNNMKLDVVDAFDEKHPINRGLLRKYDVE